VVALAGRRVDAPGAPVPRFAAEQIDLVKERLARTLERLEVDTLVASGAAGADLLAMRLVEKYARRIIILPFDSARFELSSVADRPGSWVADFRSTIATATVEIVTGRFADDDDAYVATTERILQRAIELGGENNPVGIVVWEGEPRQDSVDHTAMFVRRARELGIRIEEVSTRP